MSGSSGLPWLRNCATIASSWEGQPAAGPSARERRGAATSRVVKKVDDLVDLGFDLIDSGHIVER